MNIHCSLQSSISNVVSFISLSGVLPLMAIRQCINRIFKSQLAAVVCYKSKPKARQLAKYYQWATQKQHCALKYYVKCYLHKLIQPMTSVNSEGHNNCQNHVIPPTLQFKKLQSNEYALPWISGNEYLHP